MKDILKSQGDKRISKDAAEELGEILQTLAGDVAEEALHLPYCLNQTPELFQEIGKKVKIGKYYLTY